VRAYPTSKVGVESEILAHGERSRALFHQLSELARELRRPPSTVLILGETGTGKTVLARLLHERSLAAQPERVGRPLRMVNCAALRDALLADLTRELDDAGARGAGPSTLFLDEVGELSPWGQAVLLHRLQNESGDTRFVAATHRNLDTMASHGSFSAELLARLGGARIQLSPLRARREEIVPLALHFLRVGLRGAELNLVSMGPELFQALESYDWPGNVRELKNAMLNALAVNESGTLALSDLPDPVRCAPPLSAKGYSR
jgi:DNA-binding NtrC family response regulator